jgi:uncharacterized protein with FMN-binding domain
MRRRLAWVLLGAAVGLGLTACHSLEKIEGITVNSIAVSAVKDGTYTAAQSYFPVTAKVRVTVHNGAITGIKLLRHFHGPKHGADEILQRVMAQQSLQVDAVSGATYSSKVILKAIETALELGL